MQTHSQVTQQGMQQVAQQPQAVQPTKLHWIEEKVGELILIIIIVISLLKLYGLPADIDYFEKLFGWSAFAYLLYRVSFTKILFGNHKKILDITLLIAYFSMILKDLISYIEVIINEDPIFYEFYKVIIDYSFSIELYGFYFGSAILLLMTIYMTFFLDVRGPSFIYTIAGPLNHDTILTILIRFLAFYFTLIAFFVLVFNFIVQWLGISIVHHVIILTLLFYVVVVVKHYKKLNAEAFVYKVGTAGEEFYVKFIELFHSKSTVVMGLMGLLVLHLLIDVGEFVVPYITNNLHTLEEFGGGHESLYILFAEQIKGLPLTNIIELGVIYFSNIISLALLLIAPSILWYLFFKGIYVKLPPWVLPLIFSFIAIFSISPIFAIKSLNSENIVGVDILTYPANPAFNLHFVMLIAVGLFILFYVINKFYEPFEFITLIILSMGFLGVYVFLYFFSLVKYYIEVIPLLFSNSAYFIGFNLVIFFIITCLFYVGSYTIFIYDIFKRKLYKQVE